MPEVGVKSAEVQALGLAWTPQSPCEWGLRSPQEDEMPMRLSERVTGSGRSSGPLNQSEGTAAEGSDEWRHRVPFQLLHPLLTRRDRGREWDTLFVAETEHICGCELAGPA